MVATSCSCDTACWRWVGAICSRCRTSPFGRVTCEIVLELQQIASEYDELLMGELSVSARLNEATVGPKIGDALGSAA